MTGKPLRDKSVTFKYVTLFTLPISIVFLVGCFYVWGQNRELERKLEGNEQTLGVLEGEVYRLKQATSQRDAKLKYLTDGKLKRFKLSANGNQFVWLFYRQSDKAWYTEVTEVTTLEEGFNYKLVIANSAVGEFEKIADAVGLQKIGEAELNDPIAIYSGPRGQTEINTDWEMLYDSVSPSP